MEAQQSFIVDYMLGRLVTWLRLLGCDTLFAGPIDDAQIARIAQQQGRVVLTRDRELSRRAGIRSVLIESERVDEQVAQVIQACALVCEERLPRCTLCNGELEEPAKADVVGHVPPYVWQTQERFWRCTACGHLYWQGTHWARIRERLEAMAG